MHEWKHPPTPPKTLHVCLYLSAIATDMFFSLSLLDCGALTWAMTGLSSLFISSNTLSGFYTAHTDTVKDFSSFKDSAAVDANTSSCAHLGQLVEFDRLLKQAFVLRFKSHLTDDRSGVTGKLIYDARLERDPDAQMGIVFAFLMISVNTRNKKTRWIPN